MIFTFQLINSSSMKYIMYAKDKEDAFKVMKERFGNNANNYSLVAYCSTERFSMFI